MQEDFDGTHVVTYGVLRTYPEPLHYWIEDADLHRIAVVAAAEPHRFVDRPVRVEGRFRYDRAEGRRIEATRLESASPSP